MTLLITMLAAVTVTVIWYCNERARQLKISALCYMFWGASLMWMVDAVAEYIELREEFFMPAVEDMVNDIYLGVSVITLALVVWVAIILVKDPFNTVKGSLKTRTR